jgi:hypothetical protein
MKIKILCGLIWAFASYSSLMALDLAQNAFFKQLTGSWQAEGKLTGENDHLVTITETWSGKVETAESFSIEGTRTMNGDTQKFSWAITHNVATDSYEAVLTGGDGQTIRFEGSVSEVTQIMDLKSITGNGSSSISVQDSFKAEDKDTLHSEVTFTGDQGQTTLSGTIIHKRVKAP